MPHCYVSSAYSSFLFLLSEVTGESHPYHGKEAMDPRPGRARGSDPKHFHAVNVAQPVRFSSKLQTCLVRDLSLTALYGPLRPLAVLGPLGWMRGVPPKMALQGGQGASTSFDD